METSVRTFQVERLTSDEANLAKKVSRGITELRLLTLQRTLLCPALGGVVGFLASGGIAIFADQLAAAFVIPLPPPPSGIRLAVGLGVTFLFTIVGGIAGRRIGPSLLVEPQRRRSIERLKAFLSDRRLALVLQKLQRIQKADGELYEMAGEGYALPLSPDDLPMEVREFYPRI